MTKPAPATPLPWRVIEYRGARPRVEVAGPVGANGHRLAKLYNRAGWQQDAAYIAHAANLYGVLVEALKEIRITTTDRACVPIIEEALAKAGEQ